MSYTITTVSRRKFMPKIKPGQRQAKPPPAPHDSDRVTAQAAAPERFIRVPYRRPVRVAPTPWWKNGLAVILVNVVVVAAVGGLYVWANGADSEESGAYVPRRLTARSPSTINSRSAESSSVAPAPLAEASQVANSSAIDDIDRALRDGSRKVILPANVAGNCRIGGSDSKDFGRCLAENGARAQ